MKKILIYAGTTEGRELAEKLSGEGFLCVCCVATQYGSMVMREDERLLPGIEVRQGRLDASAMAELEEAGDFLAVVDATHPFAQDVSKNVLSSEKILREKGIQIPFFRLEREAGTIPADSCSFYESAGACADALEKTKGRILLTTGSKELSVFCGHAHLRERIVARVLPGMESLQLCYGAGLAGSQIIAMQGPFSKEMNTAILHQYRIAHLVTKESGRAGGLQDKVGAALDAGIFCHVIRRPGAHARGLGMEDILRKIRRIAHRIPGPEIYLIGTGPGSPDLLTQEAKSVITRADYIFGASRVIEPFSARMEKKAMYLPGQILPELANISGGTAAVLFSGDSGFYSGCSGMLAALKEAGYADVHVLPGISAMQLLAARTGLSWQDAGIVSLHGREQALWQADLVRELETHEKVFFLTSGVKDIGTLCALLQQDDRVVLGYQLSLPEEKIIRGTAGKLRAFSGEEGLYCGFIIRSAHRRALTHSIPDSFFIRGKVPMTKQEVRALCIEKLQLTSGSTLYDIGSGTGSIAVEAACLCASLHVYAVEMLDAALDLIRQNKEKARAFNLTVVSGKAPDALRDLPVPDAAFIGGTGGNLLPVLETLYEKNPKMRVVMTAVTLESISKMTQCLHSFRMKNTEVVQVSVSRAANLGNYRLMRAENPVYIFSFDFRP